MNGQRMPHQSAQTEVDRLLPTTVRSLGYCPRPTQQKQVVFAILDLTGAWLLVNGTCKAELSDKGPKPSLDSLIARGQRPHCGSVGGMETRTV